MATTYSTNTRLAKPAVGDTGWGVILTSDLDALDAMAPIGGLFVSTVETPSSTLNVKISAGSYVKQDMTVGTYAGIASQAITTATTKYLYLDATAAYALVVGASFPATQHVRLAIVVAGVTTITSITDARLCFPVVGT